MNPTEHTGWITVDAGRMMQAQISAVTIASPVTASPKRKNLINALPYSSSSDISPVKKVTLPKRAPG